MRRNTTPRASRDRPAEPLTGRMRRICALPSGVTKTIREHRRSLDAEHRGRTWGRMRNGQGPKYRMSRFSCHLSPGLLDSPDPTAVPAALEKVRVYRLLNARRHKTERSPWRGDAGSLARRVHTGRSAGGCPGWAGRRKSAISTLTNRGCLTIPTCLQPHPRSSSNGRASNNGPGVSPLGRT